MIGLPANTRIWIAAGVTDLRRGFTGLSALVETKLEQKPFSGHVFVFRGRRGDLIKMLWYDGDGLCLFAKRLERGRFVWPQATSGTVSLTRAQLSRTLIRSPRRPRNTNTCPENGFCSSLVSTSALSPVKPRRRSVTPAAIQIRVLAGSAIIAASTPAARAAKRDRKCLQCAPARGAARCESCPACTSQNLRSGSTHDWFLSPATANSRLRGPAAT